MDKEKVLKDLKLLKKDYTLQTLNMIYDEVPIKVFSFYQGIALGLSFAYNLLDKEGFSEKEKVEIVKDINFLVDELNKHESSEVEYKKEK